PSCCGVAGSAGMIAAGPGMVLLAACAVVNSEDISDSIASLFRAVALARSALRCRVLGGWGANALVRPLPSGRGVPFLEEEAGAGCLPDIPNIATLILDRAVHPFSGSVTENDGRSKCEILIAPSLYF